MECKNRAVFSDSNGHFITVECQKEQRHQDVHQCQVPGATITWLDIEDEGCTSELVFTDILGATSVVWCTKPAGHDGPHESTYIDPTVYMTIRWEDENHAS